MFPKPSRWDRRRFVNSSLKIGATLGFLSDDPSVAQKTLKDQKKDIQAVLGEKYPFKLSSLPYSAKALSPIISEETLLFHHGKHHQAYIDKLNKKVEGTEFLNLSLSEIIRKADGDIFNNAAQAYNHSFYWYSLKSPVSGNSPKDNIAKTIERSFGNFEEFKRQFIEQGMSIFGSGWVWLAVDSNKSISIVKTANAETPLTMGLKPLLVCDVWEHAYYIDYRNSRANYLEKFWDLIDWQFVESQLT